MLISVSLIISVILTLIWWKFLKNKRQNEILSKIAAPKSYPLIDHSGYFFKKSPDQILTLLENFSKIYGPVWYIKVGGDVSFFVEDPEILEEIFTSPKWIDKSYDYEIFNPWLGSGLVIANGQKWHQRRKIITPAFHFKILEQFVDVMEKHGEIFVEKLEKIKNQDIDVFQIVSLYTLDVICGNFF